MASSSSSMIEEFPKPTLHAFYMTLNQEKDSIPGIRTYGLDHATINANMPHLVSVLASSGDVTKNDIHKIAAEAHAFRHKQDEKTSKDIFNLMEKFGIRFHVPIRLLNNATAVAKAISSISPDDLPSFYDDDEPMGDDDPFSIENVSRARKSRKGKKSNNGKKSRKSNKSKKTKKSRKSKKSRKH